MCPGTCGDRDKEDDLGSRSPSISFYFFTGGLNRPLIAFRSQTWMEYAGCNPFHFINSDESKNIKYTSTLFKGAVPNSNLQNLEKTTTESQRSHKSALKSRWVGSSLSAGRTTNKSQPSGTAQLVGPASGHAKNDGGTLRS